MNQINQILDKKYNELELEYSQAKIEYHKATNEQQLTELFYNLMTIRKKQELILDLKTDFFKLSEAL